MVEFCREGATGHGCLPNHRARADTDCNHLAGPRVFHLLSAIVLAAELRRGADHVLVAWVKHSAARIFTLTYEIHDVARPPER